MPIKRLEAARQTLPSGYQFGDAKELPIPTGQWLSNRQFSLLILESIESVAKWKRRACR